MYDDEYKEQIRWKSRLMIPDQPQGTYSLADIRKLISEGKLSDLLAQPDKA